MIRRGFWLTAGAVTGIYGYRRASAAGRRLSASLNPTAAGRPGAAVAPGAAAVGPLTAPVVTAATVAGLARGAGMGRRGMIRLARETYRFSRDVREGMQLYLDEHPAAGSTSLATDRSTSARSTTDRSTSDLSNLAAGRPRGDGLATNLELKDGH
jgi:hypothetical protein